MSTRTSDGDWVQDFKKHVEDGGHAVLLIATEEMKQQVCEMSSNQIREPPLGSIVVAYGLEPTTWALCDEADYPHMREIMREMIARQKSLQTTLQLRVARPQDGARAIYELPMRYDIHGAIRTATDLPGTLERVQAQLFRHLHAVTERLGGSPVCSYCGAYVRSGAHETEMRIVPEEVPFVEVTVRRKCAVCADATSSPAIIVAGDTVEERARASDALHSHQLTRIRTRAAVRVAVQRQNPAALVAALEAVLDRQPAGVGLANDMLLTRAARVLVALIAEAPQMARRSRAVLRRVPEWPQIPEDDVRLCASCDGFKPKSDFSANQWRRGRRRCRECQERGLTRDAAAQARAAADADALAATFAELATRERARLDEELARRNEQYNDDECAICFERECERVVLHGEHWVCAACREDMHAHGIAQCPMCREELNFPASP